MRSSLLPWLAISLGPVMALGGCHYAANPLAGAGPFVAETHTFHRVDNEAASPQETMRRAQGYAVSIDPLLPEPGNVWPGPVPPDKSLTDIEKEQNNEQQQIDQANPAPPATNGGRRPPRGSSTPPGSVQTEPAPEPVPQPGIPPLALPPVSTAPSPLITPSGPLIPNRNNGSGIGTGTGIGPGGVPGQSILVPNGNGTTTVIGPDGSTSVVPNAR